MVFICLEKMVKNIKELNCIKKIVFGLCWKMLMIYIVFMFVIYLMVRLLLFKKMNIVKN